MNEDQWQIEQTKKLEKQLIGLPAKIRSIAYSLLTDLEQDGPFMSARTKTHDIESSDVAEVQSIRIKKSGWRDFFEEELKTHSEQGLYLRGLRLREGYTQAKLGQLIGTTQNNISSIEHGRRSIGKNLAQQLAHVFGVRYQKFL